MLQHDHFDLFGKVIIEKVIFHPPLKISKSFQDEACFFHILNGHSRLLTPTHQFSFQSKENFVLKCGTVLNRWLKKEEEQPTEVIAVHFYPDVLKEVFGDKMPDVLRAENKPLSAPAAPVAMDRMLKNYVDSLIFYFNNPSVMTDELIKLKVKEIILLLANTDSSPQLKSLLGNLFQPEQFEFKEVIHKHICEDLSVEDLARLTGFSLSSFKRKFQAVFNSSPSRYIKTKRLEKAQNLLKNTDQRISEIAFECGFNDFGHFSKSFAAAFDFSPSDYRKNHLTQISD